MVLARRVAKLEAGLDPESAVLRWLDEAHRFPTMAAYVGWLVEQPEEAHPLMRIPKQVEEATRQRLRGTYGDTRSQVRRAVHAAVLRVQLVIKLDTEAQEVIRVQGLRFVASYRHLRELSVREALAESDPRRASADRLDGDWQAWKDEVRAVLIELQAYRLAQRHLDDRYLGGHDSVFPDTGGLFDGLVDEAERWYVLAEDDPVDDIVNAAQPIAETLAERIERHALADTHWCLGDFAAARSIARASLLG